MKISQLLIVGFLIVALVLVAVGSVSYILGEEVDRAQAEMELEFDKHHHIHDLSVNLYNEHALAVRYITSNDDAEAHELLEGKKVLCEMNEESLEELDGILQGHDDYHPIFKDIRDNVNEMNELFEEYSKETNRTDATDASTISGLATMLDNIIVGSGPDDREGLDFISESIKENDIKAAENRANSVLETANAVNFFGITIAILISIALGLFIARTISRPIEEITSAVRKIKSGEFDVSVTAKGPEEMAMLTRTFNQMASSLKEEAAYRKIAEEGLGLKNRALKESEKKFRVITEKSPDAIFITDKRGNYNFVNRAACDMLGYSTEELTRMSIADITRKEDTERTFKTHQKLLQEGHIFTEVKLVRKDGVAIPADLNATVLPNGMVYGSCRDLSAFKEAQKKIENNERRLKNVLDNLQAGVILIDSKKHEIVSVNRMAAEMIGAPVDEITGNICHKFICPEEVGLCPITDLGQTIDNSERILLTADGRPIPILKTVVPIELDGRQYILDSFVDITLLKNTEKELQYALETLEEKNQELDEFVYVVSHDLKAPLITIQGFAHLLKQKFGDTLPEKGIHYIDTITEGVEELNRLVSDLLELSRAGKRKIELGTVSLDEIVKSSRKSLDGVISESNAAVESQADGLELLYDRGQLQQVMNNLIGNAVNYSRKGIVPRIKVGWKEDDAETTVWVKDNGRGILKEHMVKVFLPFERVAIDRDGTGIGLSIVKKIVERHGGLIWIESEVGEGSTFYFTVPRNNEASTGPDVKAEGKAEVLA